MNFLCRPQRLSSCHSCQLRSLAQRHDVTTPLPPPAAALPRIPPLSPPRPKSNLHFQGARNNKLRSSLLSNARTALPSPSVYTAAHLAAIARIDPTSNSRDTPHYSPHTHFRACSEANPAAPGSTFGTSKFFVTCHITQRSLNPSSKLKRQHKRQQSARSRQRIRRPNCSPLQPLRT